MTEIEIPRGNAWIALMRGRTALRSLRESTVVFDLDAGAEVVRALPTSETPAAVYQRVVAALRKRFVVKEIEAAARGGF